MNVSVAGAVAVGAELVEHGQRRLRRRQVGGQRLEVGLHLADELGGLADVAGRRAELLDLVVGLVERGRRLADPHRDADRLQLRRQLVVARRHDEVGVVPGDGLDVGRVARQVGHHGCGLGRVVGLVVDGDHLVAGADGEQRLGVGGRQRHDALRAPSPLGSDPAVVPPASVSAVVAAGASVAAVVGRRPSSPSVVTASVAVERRRRRCRMPRRAGSGRRGRRPAWTS